MSDLRSFFQRPGPAAANLLQYGPGTAIETLVSPEDLSIQERRSISERLGVDGFMGGLLDVVTDPLFLMGLITSFRFPVPTTRNIYKLGERFAAENAALAKQNSMFWRFRSAHSNFAGTKIPFVMDEMTNLHIEYTNKTLGGIAEVIQKFEKNSGRKLDRIHELVLGARLDGLDKRAPMGFKDDFGALVNLRGPGSKINDKHMDELVAGFRKVYDDGWDLLYKNPKSRETLEHALRRYRARHIRSVKESLKKSGMDSKDINTYVRNEMGRLEGDIRDKMFQKTADYMNHALMRHDPFGVQGKNFQGYSRELYEANRAMTGEEFLDDLLVSRLLGRTPEARLASNVEIRRGRMLPHIDDVEALREAGLIHEGAYKKYRNIVDTRNRTPIAEAAVRRRGLHPGEERNLVPMYSLRASNAVADYIHDTSRMRSWTTSGLGTKLVEETEKLRAVGEPWALHKVRMMEDFYYPAMLGKMTPKAYAREAKWNSMLSWSGEQLDKLRPILGDKTVESFQAKIFDHRGVPLINPASRQIADYLYTSTLGGNIASAVRNLFQLGLTTTPYIGAKYTTIGIGRALSKADEFASAYWSEISKAPFSQHNSDKAFEKVFKSYSKSGLPGSIILDDTFYRIKEALDRGRVGGMSGSWSKVRGVLMKPFEFSEKFVRSATFEGAKAKIADEFRIKKPTAKERREVAEIINRDPTTFDDEAYSNFLAGKVVQDTQFLSGPTNTPTWLLKFGPLSRQYMHFQLRYLEFLSPGGTLSRAHGGWGRGALKAYMASDLLAETAMALFNTDIDESLISGALPGLDNRGPLGILPLNPPAISLAAAGLSDLANWQFDEMRYALPTLVPGGVAGARAVGLIPGGQGAAQVLNRKYVDYENPMPDGRYPVYTGEGSLIGYAGYWDLLQIGTGLGERGQMIQTEQEGFRWLQKNAEQFRGYSKAYANAVLDNDMNKASKLDMEFQARYNTSIRNIVSPQTLDRYRKNRQISRIEKILDTLPAEVRPQYAMALQVAMLHDDSSMLGLLGPGLTGGQTAKQRDPYRFIPQVPKSPFSRMLGPGGAGNVGLGTGNGTGSLMNPWGGNMGPLSTQNPYEIGSQGLGGSKYTDPFRGFNSYDREAF